MAGPKEIKFKKLPTPKGEDKRKIDQVFDVDTRYGIIMAIDNFGSLNIKKLAKILGKNEATIHHHVKWLIQDPSMLDIDQKKTMQTKGIFYTLSTTARKYRQILGLTPSTEEQNQPGERKESEKITDLLSLPVDKLTEIHIQLLQEITSEDTMEKEKRLITYNHVLEDIMLQNLEHSIIALKEDKQPKNTNYPLGALSNFSLDMKVSNIKHLYRLLLLFAKLSEDVQELKQEISEEIDRNEIEEEEIIDLHFHIVGGEIAEFEFEE